jgi:hypothetical protein
VCWFTLALTYSNVLLITILVRDTTKDGAAGLYLLHYPICEKLCDLEISVVELHPCFFEQQFADESVVVELCLQ